MLEQVSNYDQEIRFVTGFAGSGKSTKLSKSATPKTLVLVPTHEAAKVLHSKGIKAYTIHSVLSLVPTLNFDFRKGQRLQVLKKIGQTDLSTIEDVFIDEFSMISTEILDHLLEVLPPHCKVTVFGDPYQLPPVSGTPIEADYYTEDIEDLTIQHRADNPHIVETFMRFKEYIRTGNSKISLVLNPSIKKGTLKDFNPETDRALAYTNSKVISINNAIAGILNMPKELSVDESIVINDIFATYKGNTKEEYITIYPNCISKGALQDETTLAKTIEKTKRDIEKYSTDLSMYETTTVSIDDEEYQIYYSADHYAEGLTLKKEVEKYQHLVADAHNLDKETQVSKWCSENRDAQYVKERGKAWSDYLKHQNLVFNFRRPFATTVHKAQGKEFSKVYIAQEDIKKSIRPGYYMTYARLMYVALSRAINEVIIID